jgi:hypothetical protein
VHVDETTVPVDYTQDYRRFSYTDFELNCAPADSDGRCSMDPAVCPFLLMI